MLSPHELWQGAFESKPPFQYRGPGDGPVMKRGRAGRRRDTQDGGQCFLSDELPGDEGVRAKHNNSNQVVPELRCQGYSAYPVPGFRAL